VEGQEFGLAPIDDLYESSDADRCERAGRRCADLGKVDV
jgi:hypothetical protein